MPNCILCDCELAPCDLDRADPALSVELYAHPASDECLVRHCDRFGVCIDEIYDTFVATASANDDAPEEVPGSINLSIYPSMDVALGEAFQAYGLERLGGQSTGRGWSSFNLFQKCPYAWKRRYIEKAKPLIVVEAPSIAIGSLFHALVAVMYMRQVVDGYPLTPDRLHELVRARAQPEYVKEGWRVFTAYRLFYAYDNFTPLAVEYDLRDPRNGESCRYDLIAYFSDEAPMRLPGTYIVEHKTAGRFDMATTDGWGNDGEVLGQVMLWKRLGLDKRFGPLRGVIVNIAGKQKDPQFHRTIVAPSSWQMDAHADELKRWEGNIQLSRSTNNFPRARHSCVGRFGLCEWFDHCSEPPTPTRD